MKKKIDITMIVFRKVLVVNPALVTPKSVTNEPKRKNTKPTMKRPLPLMLPIRLTCVPPKPTKIKYPRRIRRRRPEMPEFMVPEIKLESAETLKVPGNVKSMSKNSDNNNTSDELACARFIL